MIAPQVETKKTCGLAKASLALSCCTLLIPFFAGSIAGIICGHKALKEIDRNPQLEGRSLAKWGLIIGYTSFVWVPVLLFGFLWITGLPHGTPVWRR
jgi:hypothetical protein